MRPARLEDLALELLAGLQVDVVGAVDGARLGFVFFNDTATTEIYTLSLHDALPIYRAVSQVAVAVGILELDARDGARRVVAEVAVGEGARREDGHPHACSPDTASARMPSSA